MKIGKLLWKSQCRCLLKPALLAKSNLTHDPAASSITVHLLNTLQFLLPAHTAGKDSPRTVACRILVTNQGWSKDIIKESFRAIGKMDKKLCPDVGLFITKPF